MTAPSCEKSYAADAKYGNFYLGGDVSWNSTGEILYCLNGNEVNAVDVQTGLMAHSYGIASNSDEDEEDVIYTFALAPNDTKLVTAHRSGLLRLWSLETHKVEKLWKAQHKGPVTVVAFSACNQLICTSGAADSTLRIWDYANNRCLCALKDYQAPATLLRFHPNEEIKELFAVGADNAIYCWNYESKELKHKFSGHLSQVTAFSFASGGDTENIPNYLASVGRDKVLIVWDLQQSKQYKVIPMYEELEGVCFLDEDKLKVVVASSNGNLKLVHCHKAKIVGLIENADFETKFLLQCKKQKQLALVTTEQNILIYEIASKTTMKCVKQLVGNNDEILDLCFLGEKDRFLAVATNSKSIKLYDTNEKMNCKVIYGHKDTVMCLSSCGSNANEYLLSAGKDCSIHLWQLDAETFDLNCIGKHSHSHTSTIGSISFGYHAHTIFATASQDGSMKVWSLKQDKSQESTEFVFNVRYAAIAHDKEVNCVAFAPNNKMLATASQDKTVKVWNTETQSTLATLRGHIRGVWCVRFSPVDQVLLSTSSDCSIRLWSLTNMSCLKRFEQECTVLRAEFIDHGKYIVSASSDGLMKTWNIKTNACVQTLDEHTDRIWSLAVSERSNKLFYSGGADSKLVKWRDVTAECRNKEIDERQTLLQQEQHLQTLMQQRQHMQKAFFLALSLGKPKTTYKILAQYIRQRDEVAIQKIIMNLNADQRQTLLEHVKAWSTNSRHSKVANLILNFMLSDILANPDERLYKAGNMVEVLTPYVQRHFKRVNELNKELTFLEFLVKKMEV